MQRYKKFWIYKRKGRKVWIGARNIDSKTKKATIIGIMATHSGNVVPNAVTR